MTEGGYQAGQHFLAGCNKFITCSSMVRKKSNLSHCWLRSDIDSGSALKGDIEFRGVILNLSNGNCGISDTYRPISMKSHSKAGDKTYYHMYNIVQSHTFE